MLEIKNKSGKVDLASISVGEKIIGDVISDNDIYLTGGWLTISNQTINAPNVFITGGSVYLSDGAKIDADLVNESGTLFVTGKSEVTGNYYITSHDGTSHSNGYLRMTDENGHLTVYGDFVMDSRHSHSSELTNGVLEIKGDFTQKSTYSGNYSNFYASGTHKVVLSGSGEQVVSFEDPSYSHFNMLEITNIACVVFATAYKYNELQIIYPFDFDVAKYNAETNQINVNVTIGEGLKNLNGNVIISLYDANNKLIECRIKELSELEPQTFNGLNDYDGSYIVKAFYWADMTSIKPLCPSIQKELATN